MMLGMVGRVAKPADITVESVRVNMSQMVPTQETKLSKNSMIPARSGCHEEPGGGASS